MASAARFIPLSMLAICAAALAALIARYRLRFGRSPVRLFRSGRGAQSLREARLLLLGVILGWQALAAAFGIYFPLAAALFNPRPVLGALVFLASILLIAVAVVTMGASWQMGADPNFPSAGLITGGVFRYSRNPIYLGIAVAMAGWMLLLPTWLSLIWVIGVIPGVRRQALEEEAFLIRTYGAEFNAWAHEVGRFVPWLGRLR